ncbi:MAG TPA: DUF4192 domain-containing protein [Actinomycetales bacterium]|nr:DUF4192 domain-containing protein [Actinomycetales bacterium]
MTTDTLRVSHPSDLLAYVPYRVGYQPSRSIVLVCLRGPRHRVGLVTRVDLPPDGAALDVQVQRLVAFAASDGATAVVLVVYAEPGDESVAHADVVRTVQDETEAADLELLDAYLVGRGRYSSLVCDNPRCCPPAGHPLSDLASSVVSAEMVALGAVVGADRAEALGNLTPADDDRRARVERAAGLAASTAPVRPAKRARWRSRLLTAWRREAAAAATGADGEVPADVAGSLLAGLDDPTLRDAVMLSCVPGCGLAPEALAAHGLDQDVASLLDRVFDAEDAIRPDGDRADASSAVLRSLVRQGTPPRTAAPLGLLAWLSWWHGDGSTARSLVDLALASDPGHRLALLLGEALDRGVPPGWAQRDRQLDLTGAPRE